MMEGSFPRSMLGYVVSLAASRTSIAEIFFPSSVSAVGIINF